MTLTLYGAPIGADTAVTYGVPEGNSNRLAYDAPASAEYGINENVIVRGALSSKAIFNFNHVFTVDQVPLVKAMAFIALKRESERVTPYHVFLADQRCKVPDTNPPTYAYVAGSMEVVGNGATTQTHRIYKAIFRNGLPTVGKTYTNGSEELIFEMQIGDPYFASEQLPAPALSLRFFGSVPENADTSSVTHFIAEFS